MEKCKIIHFVNAEIIFHAIPVKNINVFIFNCDHTTGKSVT